MTEFTISLIDYSLKTPYHRHRRFKCESLSDAQKVSEGFAIVELGHVVGITLSSGWQDDNLLTIQTKSAGDLFTVAQIYLTTTAARTENQRRSESGRYLCQSRYFESRLDHF